MSSKNLTNKPTRKPKRDYTELKTSIVKTSWLTLLRPAPMRDDDDPEEYAEMIASNKWKRSMSIMVPNTAEQVTAKISDAGKAKIVAAGKLYLKELKALCLKTALEANESCETEEDLDDEEFRWNPILDGNSRKMLKLSEDNAGFSIIRVSTRRDFSVKGSQPSIINVKTGEQVVDPKAIGSGCWVKAFTTVYAYDIKGNAGVGVGLNNVLMCYKGEQSAFSGKSFDADEVEEFEEGAEDDLVDEMEEEEDSKPAKRKKAVVEDDDF